MLSFFVEQPTVVHKTIASLLSRFSLWWHFEGHQHCEKEQLKRTKSCRWKPKISQNRREHLVLFLAARKYFSRSYMELTETTCLTKKSFVSKTALSSLDPTLVISFIQKWIRSGWNCNEKSDVNHYQEFKGWKSRGTSLRSNKGLTLEVSTLETLYGCQFILSTQLIIKTTSSRGTSSFQLQSVPYNVHQDMQSNTRNYLTMNFLCQWVGW